MKKAFEDFKEIQKLESNFQRHRQWLKKYEGKYYSIAKKGKDLVSWSKQKEKYIYDDSLFDKYIETKKGDFVPGSSINKIQRHPRIFVIEFDDKIPSTNIKNKEKIEDNLKKIEETLKNYSVGFIRSTHDGSSDYIWIEYERDLTDDELKKIIKILAPIDSEVDENFSSSKRRLPVLFAEHWKYGILEEPISFHEGKKLNDNILSEIAKEKGDFQAEDKIDKTGYKTSKIFTRRGQVESFFESQPFFYDKAKIFWLWDSNEKRWFKSDEIDLLNQIQKNFGVETINSKAKSEFVSAFQQVGREKIPKQIKKTWIQFKNKIYDIETDESFEATPEYFVTNPIPYNIGESEETPIIDNLFCEWVGEENKNQLYEFIAYTISQDQFMQRLFALCGGGANGKGTFMKLVVKFIGNSNSCSSEIKALSESRFEVASLYKKLLCVAGEVSYGDLKNTNILKKISGEDKISFEFKGKDPITDDNTATFVCLTNSLPETPDKSLGFYRRWLIIDFPNQFTGQEKNPLTEIPEEEFENLAKKSLNILKQLYRTRKFTNEGNFQERAEKYEEHSNPVMKFVEKFCEEEVGESTELRKFTTEFNKFAKNSHIRQMTARQVGSILRENGFEVGVRKIDGISSRVILNLSLNFKDIDNIEKMTTRTTETTQSSTKYIHGKSVEGISSSGSSGSSESSHNLSKLNIDELYKDE